MKLSELAKQHEFLAWHEPKDEGQLRELLGRRGEAQTFAPIGRGSRLGLGAPMGRGSELLSLAQLDQVVEMDAADLCITVQPGVTLGEIERVIAPHGLMLDSGPFAGASERTIGGLLAEAPPSSRGFDRGALRSQVLGLRGIDGKGRVFKAGGRVIKNVAGYDLMRLFVGSGGAFFVAVELTLRLVRIPPASVLMTSELLDREAAVMLWLQTRREQRELRIADVELEKDGRARVRIGFEGPVEHMEGLRARPPRGFLPIEEDPRALNGDGIGSAGAKTAGVPGSASSAGAAAIPDGRTWLRGFVRPSRIADLLIDAPAGSAGQVHLQGDLQLSLPAGRGFSPHFRPPEDAVLRVLATPSPEDARLSTELDGSVVRAAQRIRTALGAAFAPGRLSFDTPNRYLGAQS
jgi:FAD/FMN-containing dehydrogenase